MTESGGRNEGGSRNEDSVSNASQGVVEVNYMQAVAEQLKSKFPRNRNGQSAKGSHENLQTH